MDYWNINPEDQLLHLTCKGRNQLSQISCRETGASWFFTADGGLYLTTDHADSWHKFKCADTVRDVQNFCNPCNSIDYQI